MALGFLFIDFLYFIDIMLLGVTVGVVVVSYCVYKPSLESNFICDEDSSELYEYKYLDEYNDLLDKKEKSEIKKSLENADNTTTEEDNENNKNDEQVDTSDNTENSNNTCDTNCQCDTNEQESCSSEEEEESYYSEEHSDTTEEDSEEDSEPYEENNDLPSLKNIFIEENTPRGIIFMAYDYDVNSYIYYSKTKDIPYKYLETVSRKYIIENKCLDIFIDYKEEYRKGLQHYVQRMQEKKNLLEKNKEQEKDNQEDNIENKKKNIYANFKSYNKLDKNDTKDDTNAKEYILTENSNHYKYQGNIDDYYKMLKQKEQANNDLKEYEQIDFKSYKNNMKKEN